MFDEIWIAGDLPVVISCASLALADAGIMMYDLVTSVSVSCLGKNLVIDPILEEESSYQDGSLIIACMPSHNEVNQLTVTGEWSTAKIHEAMELCLNACAKLGEISNTKTLSTHFIQLQNNSKRSQLGEISSIS